jgi:pimeloyl-ACP methyl ester carboxylesterase/DNA-binding CsgD family transcriptional regulator
MEQTIRFCRSADGTTLAYATSGTGPPLLLVGSWMNVSHLERDWAPGSPFKEVLEALSRHFTLARYDPRGTGLSDRSVGEYGLNAQLSDLEAVVAALGWPRLSLLGVQIGGATAISYAATRPAALDRLVIYHTTPHGPGLVDDEQRGALRDLMRAHFGVATRAWAEWFAPSRVGDSDFVAELSRTIRDAVTMEDAVGIFEVQQSVDVRALLPEVAVPTLVVHSSGNRVMPIRVGREIASGIPGARLVALPGVDDIPATPAAVEGLVGAARAFIIDDAGEAATPTASNPLTPREREVLTHVAEGRTNREIAGELGISVYTVNRHVSSLLAKTGSANRAEAVRWAAQRELLADASSD